MQNITSNSLTLVLDKGFAVMGSLVREWVGFQQFQNWLNSSPNWSKRFLLFFPISLKLKSVSSLWLGCFMIAGHELIDSCCYGKRRCRKIIHRQLSYWWTSRPCQSFPGMCLVSVKPLSFFKLRLRMCKLFEHFDICFLIFKGGRFEASDGFKNFLPLRFFSAQFAYNPQIQNTNQQKRCTRPGKLLCISFSVY